MVPATVRSGTACIFPFRFRKKVKPKSRQFAHIAKIASRSHFIPIIRPAITRRRITPRGLIGQIVLWIDGLRICSIEELHHLRKCERIYGNIIIVGKRHIMRNLTRLTIGLIRRRPHAPFNPGGRYLAQYQFRCPVDIAHQRGNRLRIIGICSLDTAMRQILHLCIEHGVAFDVGVDDHVVRRSVEAPRLHGHLEFAVREIVSGPFLRRTPHPHMLARIHYPVRRELILRRERLAQRLIVLRAYRHSVRRDVHRDDRLLRQVERDGDHAILVLGDFQILDLRHCKRGDRSQRGQ